MIKKIKEINEINMNTKKIVDDEEIIDVTKNALVTPSIENMKPASSILITSTLNRDKLENTFYAELSRKIVSAIDESARIGGRSAKVRLIDNEEKACMINIKKLQKAMYYHDKKNKKSGKCFRKNRVGSNGNVGRTGTGSGVGRIKIAWWNFVDSFKSLCGFVSGNSASHGGSHGGSRVNGKVQNDWIKEKYGSQYGKHLSRFEFNYVEMACYKCTVELKNKGFNVVAYVENETKYMYDDCFCDYKIPWVLICW